MESLRLLAALGGSRCNSSGGRADGDGAVHRGIREAQSSCGADCLPSFEEVLRLYHKRIYNLVYRLVGNFDESADLTQEVFVKAYRAYDRFRGESSAVYPWLCRIAVNSCKNRFKEMDRRTGLEVLSLDDPLEMDDSEVQLEVRDESFDPAAVVARREVQAKIQDAIQVLPSEYRTVIVLRDMDGLSYKEIVEVTGLSMEMVKARLFRARRILRRRLAPYLEA